MPEILQGKRRKLIYDENFMYKINKKTTQKYIWNAIADAVQE